MKKTVLSLTLLLVGAQACAWNPLDLFYSSSEEATYDHLDSQEEVQEEKIPTYELVDSEIYGFDTKFDTENAGWQVKISPKEKALMDIRNQSRDFSEKEYLKEIHYNSLLCSPDLLGKNLENLKKYSASNFYPATDDEFPVSSRFEKIIENSYKESPFMHSDGSVHKQPMSDKDLEELAETFLQKDFEDCLKAAICKKSNRKVARKKCENLVLKKGKTSLETQKKIIDHIRNETYSKQEHPAVH